MFKFMCFSIILSFVLFFNQEVLANESEDNVEVIKHIILKQLSLNPKHVLKKKKNISLLNRVVAAIDNASKVTKVPWEEIVVTSYCESTFRGVKTKGKSGETGFMQLHRKAPWKYCEEKLKRPIDKYDIEDQYLCGGFWLKKYKNECDGSFKQGSAKYMSGGVCKPEKGGRLWSAVVHRMRILKKVKKDRDDFNKKEN